MMTAPDLSDDDRASLIETVRMISREGRAQIINEGGVVESPLSDAPGGERSSGDVDDLVDIAARSICRDQVGALESVYDPADVTLLAHELLRAPAQNWSLTEDLELAYQVALMRVTP